MDSLHQYEAHDAIHQDRWAVWRALPRLLVSRQWRWITLGVIIIAIGLMRLGFWQLDRLAQRRAHNALIASRITGPPLELRGQPLDVEANEFRSVVVKGEFDPSQEVVLRNRSFNEAPGYDILTPLRIEGSDKSVLIDRGWIPVLDVTPEKRKQFAVTGPVTITGIVRKPQVRIGSLSPVDQQPPGGRLDAWFRVDVARIANQVPYPLLPFYIEQSPSAANTALPQPQLSVDYQDEGPHLSYALQWFSFTLILLGGYAALVVNKTEQEKRLTQQRASH